MKITARTIEYSICKGKLVQKSMTATRTGLASVGRIYSNENVASFFRFATQHTEKSRPSRIVNTFGKAMVMYHPIDSQILNKNLAIGIDYFSAGLVREVRTLEPDAFVGSGNRLASKSSFRSAFNFFGKSTLNLCQCLFFFTKEAGIFNLSTIGESGKSLKSNVYANAVIQFWQAFRLDFNREAGVPFARRTASEREGFNCTFYGTVQRQLEIAYLGNFKAVAHQLKPALGIGETIVPSVTFEAGIAGFFFASFNTAKVSLYRPRQA